MDKFNYTMLCDFYELTMGNGYFVSGMQEKISYFDYISSLKNPDCNEALKRVCSRIDLDAIHNFLEGVPELLPIQREFYLTMLTERKEKILDYSLELLMEQEQHTSPTLGM